MKAVSFKSVVIDKKLLVNPTIRYNENGYLFITVVDTSKPAGQGGENIYFGRKTAEQIKDRVDIRGIANELQYIETTNAQGESRVKLSLNTYVSADTLFGA